MKMNEMNKNQQYAFMQVYHAANWIVGGYENDVQDGHRASIPSYDELSSEIYDTVMTSTTGEDFQQIGCRDEIRFAGKAFIMERIEKRLAKMGIVKRTDRAAEIERELNDVRDAISEENSRHEQEMRDLVARRAALRDEQNRLAN